MKKLFLMFGVMALAMTAFTGCKDDDKDKVNYGAVAAGTYKGTLVLTGIEGLEELPNQTFVITRKSDNTVDIKAQVDAGEQLKFNVEAKGLELSGKLDDIAIKKWDGKIDLTALGEDNKEVATTIKDSKITTQNKLTLVIEVTGVKMEGVENPVNLVIKTTDAAKITK